jgi:hypothetical protein
VDYKRSRLAFAMSSFLLLVDHITRQPDKFPPEMLFLSLSAVSRYIGLEGWSADSCPLEAHTWIADRLEEWPERTHHTSKFM